MTRFSVKPLSGGLLGVFLLLGTAAFALADAPPPPAAGSSGEPGERPVEVHGDSVEYFHEDQKVVGIGNVSIDYEDVKLTADKITVYMASKQALAEGHVVLTQKGSVFRGERGEYDFAKRSGNVDGMKAFIPPALSGRARRIEKVSDDHYLARDSTFTTCDPDNPNPFYRIQARDIDIYPGKKVVIRNALLFIKGVPVLFIPVYIQPLIDFDRFPVQIVPGKNVEWGPFVLSKWRYELADGPALKSKGNLLLDYRAKRGVGVGAENFYSGDRVGRGAARVYYADDHDAAGGVDAGRYRGQLRHQRALGESTALTAEMNKLSDPDIVKDFFFHEEYERDVFPDNYVSIITAKPEYTFSFLERERMDDFFTVVERSPELRFDTHTRRFAETPFYLRQEFQFANLKKEFARSETQFDALRFDVNQTLFYDGEIGALNVTPRVGTRQTYYSRRIVDTEDLVRGTFDPGLDLSIRFFKTYDWSTKVMGLDYNGIRHIFTPTASYNFRPNPTAPRTILQQFDAIDALDKRNFFRFNFENKLQTKEHAADGTLVAREIARVIPFFDMDYDTHRVDNVGIDVELRPYSWMGIDADAGYDTRTRDVKTANIDFYFDRGPVRFGIGQRFVDEESSLTTAEVRWRLNDLYEMRVYERFEFETEDSEEFEATLSRTFECVIVDLTYNHRDGSTFFVALRLKGFPKASISLSQSYNRPKASPASSRI